MKIYCDKCGGVIAHIVGKTMIESVRQGHKTSITGKDYLAILTCPNTGKCDNKVAITCEDGQLLLENLQTEEKNEIKKTKKTNDDGTEVIDEGKDGEGAVGEEPVVTDPEPNTTEPNGGGSDDGGENPTGEETPEGTIDPKDGGSNSNGGESSVEVPSPEGEGNGQPSTARKYTRV